MRWSHAGYVLAAMLLLAAPSAQAQGDFLNNPQLQQMIHKFWNPVVGMGEVYQNSDASGGEWRTVQLSVVGRETVEGKQAYWLEMTVDVAEMGGTIYAKDLIVPDEETPRRIIMQLPGEAAMELPMRSRPKPRKVEDRHAHKVGAETITVPAGTFACEHWKDDNSDAWLSSKVSPMTVVKTVSKNKDDVVLLKVISGAKDHITGPIKPFDPSVFMRHMKQPGGGN